MTHDELLAKINKEIQPCGTHTHSKCKSKEENLPWITLRAVVELHKPYMYDGRMGQYERCSFCTTEEEWLGEIYPCPTIEKIMDELK